VQWVLRTDGGLLALTYERFFGVAAWSKHATQGRITALETFFGGAVRKDQVMLVVERDKWDGSALVPAVYLEALAETSRNNFVATPTDAGDWEYAGLPPSAWFSYVDSLYLTFGTGSATLPVPPRFVQKSVVVVQNGVVLGDFVVPTTGTITLPYPTIVGATINVGYRYPARVVPNRIELAVGNTAQSQRVRWTKPRFRLFESVRPVVNGQPARERSQGDNYDIATSLISGDIEIVNLDDSGDLVIEANEPLPFHMTGIFGLLTVEGG
jgi:hypothetical protein